MVCLYSSWRVNRTGLTSAYKAHQQLFKLWRQRGLSGRAANALATLNINDEQAAAMALKENKFKGLANCGAGTLRELHIRFGESNAT